MAAIAMSRTKESNPISKNPSFAALKLLGKKILHSSNTASSSSSSISSKRKNANNTGNEKVIAHVPLKKVAREPKKVPTERKPKTVADKITYNPYGLNSNSYSANGRMLNQKPQGADAITDLSFYLQDGDNKIRLLPLPIADPNIFLPCEMQQDSVLLNENFVFDEEKKVIGSGGSSEVKKVASIRRRKDVYALKKLNMIYDETPEKFYKRCSKEYIIGKHLSLGQNIHIINTVCLVKVPTSSYSSRGWGVVMELGSKDLFQLIEKTGWRNVPLGEKFCIFKQVAQGVKFMHDQGIAHRDLKPENVLLSKDGVCKLTDFGISDWYHEDPYDFESPIKTCAGMIGSAPYAAPEVMLFDSKKGYPETLQKRYNPLKLDCYSLGIILMTLVNGMIPFMESCNKDSGFREYQMNYEKFIRHHNPRFREKHWYKPGPGSEYSLARNFKDTNASRLAWRLADPNVETRYTMDDLFMDPWFIAIDTCVEPDEVCILPDPLFTKRQDSLIDPKRIDSEDCSSVSSSKTAASNVSLVGKLSIKPRSMVDIAASPNLIMHHHKEKALFTLDEDRDEDEQEKRSLKEIDIYRSTTTTMKKSNVLPLLSTNRFPTPHTSSSESPMTPLRKFSDLSIGSTYSSSTFTKTTVGPSSISSTASSIHSGQSRRRKKLIHDHLHVVSSVTRI